VKKKIRLDLNDLKVESFVTSEGMTLKEGTVFGMSPNTVCEWTCNEVTDTCDGIGACVNSNQCNWTTDAQAQSCQGGGTGGTLPPPPTIAGCGTGETCPETPDSCDGQQCQPN
jgi:hypothetical protein